jgi:AcrR family transcriptional regulator
MPRLWDATIESHRAAVRDATIATTAELVAKHGAAGVTMSQIAKETGIGRATLYKYFPDVESIMLAWHEHHVAQHLAHLKQIRDRSAGASLDQLRAVLLAYAESTRAHDGSEIVAQLHRGEHVARVAQDLEMFISELVAAAATEGAVRTDVPPLELAAFCLHALEAAPVVNTPAASERLVGLVLRGMAPAS